MSSRNSSNLAFSSQAIISVKSKPIKANNECLTKLKPKPLEHNQTKLKKPFLSLSNNASTHPNNLAKPATLSQTKLAQPVTISAANSAAVSYPPKFSNKHCLTADEIALSVSKTLSNWQNHSELWLFAYGSLIWKPEGKILNKMQARLDGYHRGLYLWSKINRGTHTQPGLVLALDQGGSCLGVALQLCTKNIVEDFTKLWQREMASDAYQPTWLPCVLNDGRRVNALTFIIRRNVSDYAGELPESIINQVITCAEGKCGSTLDYIQRTCEALRQYGIPDNSLERIFKRCCQHIQQHKNVNIQLK